MNALKEQAINMVYSLPDEKMSYIIDLLKMITGMLKDESEFADKALTTNKDNSSAVSEAWKKFRSYKGIIPYSIDEKAELAKARDEKYAGSV